MEISCEPLNLSCIKPPTVSDINKIKTANIVPDSLVDKIFSGLASDYKELKKNSPSKSIKSKSKSKSSSKSKKSKSKTQGGKGKKTRKWRMKGGALSEYQKNRLTDIVILLVAGSGAAASVYWSIPTAIEAYIVSIGILPKLCGQNMLENFVVNFASTLGAESCVARTTRYNTMVVGLVAIITATGWFSPSMFYKSNLIKNYNKVHKQVKQTLFVTSDALTTSPSKSRSRSRSRSPQASASASVSRKREASPKASKSQKIRSKSPSAIATATGR